MLDLMYLLLLPHILITLLIVKGSSMNEQPWKAWSGISRLLTSIKADERHLEAAPLGPRQKIWLQRRINQDRKKLKDLRTARRNFKKKNKK